MATRKSEGHASWSDVKKGLAGQDREGLLKLVQDLYGASRENQTFLHARLGLGGDVLKPYKATISRWLWPDFSKNQDPSIATAKKAIANYKKAVGQADGLADLMTYYCEQASGFCDQFGVSSEAEVDTLMRMFEQALRLAVKLPESQRDDIIFRLDKVRNMSHNFGYGVGDEMDDLLLVHGVERD